MQAPSPAFAEFQRLVVEDPVLFAQFESAPTPDTFVALAIRLGAERGLVFTAEEVQAALLAARREWIERNLA